ncbi:MAG: methionine biosynthesis protein MetW [Alphaproteobacteria bacterium]|nr:methionine biosynthesis protein MetW [Alphaproteobacteria bacterium]
MTQARPALKSGGIRVDLQLIAEMVPPACRVLDIGCGDGTLLEYLWREKQVDGRGIELGQAGVNACVERGLSVIQGDADTDLIDYPDHAFDFAVLSQTLQAVRRPDAVLTQLLRIGHQAIVSFPNLGHWRARLALALHGRSPLTALVGHPWYDSPNIHPCTIRDFVQMCDGLGIRIRRSIAVDGDAKTAPFTGVSRLANLFGVQAVFLLGKD